MEVADGRIRTLHDLTQSRRENAEGRGRKCKVHFTTAASHKLDVPFLISTPLQAGCKARHGLVTTALAFFGTPKRAVAGKPLNEAVPIGPAHSTPPAEAGGQ